MRSTFVTTIGLVVALAACGKGAVEQAKQEAAKEEAKEMAEKKAAAVAPPVQRPPVPGMAHVKCEQLIDVAKFQAALGETEPVSVRDTVKNEPEAAASCGIVRGGKKLTEAQQKAMLKKEGRLGVLPGDELCRVSAFCWTIEKEDLFRANYCKKRKELDDETMGSYACKQVVAVGADDVFVFRFFDPDTKCIFQVAGGPSQVDNDMIRKCAVTARDAIGPAQISVDGSAPAPAAPAAPDGSAGGSGSAK